MKSTHNFRSVISICLAVVFLAGIAYVLQAARSALAQGITDVNPVANAGPDRSVIVGAAVILDGSGSYDPDDDLPLSYLWSQTGGPGVTFNPMLSITTFTAPPAPTVLTFTLAVTDSLGFADPTPDEVLVHVLGEPIANDDSGAGFSTDEDTPFITADVLANDFDPGGSPLALQSFDASGTVGQVSLAQPAGSLDITGFNPPDGYVMVDYDAFQYRSYAVAIQSDGKSIVAGYADFSGESLFAMERYNADGSLDTAFGVSGVVTTHFNDFDTAWAIAIRPDNKILLAGKSYDLSTDNTLFALARYNPDGSLDNTFGSGGKVTTDFDNFNTEIYGMATQPDGKIVLAGATANNYPYYDVALVRYNPDGSLDSTFGSGGKVITDFGGRDGANDIVIQPDGKIIIVGDTDISGESHFALARYLADGSLDSSFGSGGLVTTAFSNSDGGQAVVLQPDGKIVAVGVVYTGFSNNFAMARFNPGGSLDTTFGIDGKITIDYGGDDLARDVILLPDEGFVVAGYTCLPDDVDFALARLNSDGSLDPNFGQDGKSTADFNDDDYGIAITLQQDGNIIMAGGTILSRFSGNDAGFFTYNPSGVFDYLAAGEIATDTFTYVASNGLLTDTAVVSITIAGINYPPVAVAGSDQNIGVGATVTLDGRGSTDPDGDLPLSYLWAQTGGPAVTFNPALSVTSFTAPAYTTALTFTLTVTDHAGMASANPDETVVRVFESPVAVDDSGPGFTTGANTAFLTADVLANDYDPGGSPLAVQSFDTNGTLGLVSYGLRPGDLDTDGFGAPNGYVFVDFGTNWDYGYDLTIQPDNKIVIAGGRNTTNKFTLARLNPSGSLDPSFGDNGVINMNFDGYEGSFQALTLQTDEKIVAAGDSGYSYAVARFNPDSSLDNTFDGDGKVTTSFGYGNEAIPEAIAVQADGKVVVAGTITNDDTGDSSIALVRYNVDGSLDTTFGTGGIVITSNFDYAHGHDMVIQTDGKIVVVGCGRPEPGAPSDFLVVRYNPDGSLDATFGNQGRVFTDFGYYDYGYSVVLQENQIIAAGRADDANDYGRFALARYNPNGSLDFNFGNDGKVITEGGSGIDITLQPDGKIVLMGDQFEFVRYNFDGSLDLTFGENGKVIPGFGNYVANAVTIQADGMIVATGSQGYGGKAIVARFLNQGNGTFNYDPNRQFAYLPPGEIATDTFTYNITNGALTGTAVVSITIIGGDFPPVAMDDSGPAFTTQSNSAFLTGDVLLNDYDPEGEPVFVESFDTSGTIGLVTEGGGGPAGSLDMQNFGAPNGYITIDFGNEYSESHAVAIQANGKVIVAGRSCDYECGNQDFALARYNTNGSPDTTFGNNGNITTDFGDTSEAYAVAIQTNGKIIAAGYTWSGGGDFALARYNPDGSLDNSFGNNGKITTDFGYVEFIQAIAIQPDGGIVAFGFTANGNSRDFALARYTPDGNLDTSFGAGGKVITDFGKFDSGLDVAIQPDGKIVAGGNTYADDYADSNFALARYQPDGSLDNTFGSGGKVITDLSYNSEDYAAAIALQSDGKIVATGNMVDLGYNIHFVLARYNPDGSLDNSFGSGYGVVITYFGDDAQSEAVAIQTDGKIVAAGSVNNPYGSDLALARYNLDGSLDVDFGNEGTVVADLGSAEMIQHIAIQTDGKIDVTGYNLLARYLDGTENSGVFYYDPNGQFNYLTPGEIAVDTFTYVVSDGVLTSTATVSITIIGAGTNNPPVAVDDSGPDFTTNEDTPFTTGDVLENDIDPEGQPLSVDSFATSGTLGVVTFVSGGTFTYDPDGQFDYLQIGETATDTFTYVVSDGVLTDTATVSITVSGVNDSPLFISTPITTAVATAQYTYTVTTDDPDDSDIHTITGTTLPAWLNLTDHGDRSALLSGTPSTPGSFPVVLQVTDGIASASHAFTITVSEIPATPAADLSITQGFEWTSASSGVFTLTVTNLGPDEAPGAVVSDTFPAGFAGITWTCTGSGGAACTASGSGNINDTLASFPAGGMVTYTILVGTIPAGEWTNTVEVIAPAGVDDPDPENNRASVSFELVPVYLPVVGKP